MSPVIITSSLRGLLALDARVGRAQLALQEIGDSDPAIENRIRELMRLVEARDRAMVLPSWRSSPTAPPAG